MPGSTLNRTALGWPYLDLDNNVDIVPAYTLDLANKLQNSDAATARAENAATRAENAAAAIGFKFAHGIQSFTAPATAAGGTVATITINFPAGRFTARPDVTFQLWGANANLDKWGVVVNDCTASSVTVRIVANASTTALASVPLMWIAVQ